MNEKNILLLKLYNGDLIMGTKCVPESDETSSPQVWGRIYLKDPRQVMVIPTVTGDVRLAIASVCHPFKVKRLEEKLYINSTQVMYTLEEDEIEKELLDGYKSEVSGIRIATASETAAVNSNKPDGDFIIT